MADTKVGSTTAWRGEGLAKTGADLRPAGTVARPNSELNPDT